MTDTRGKLIKAAHFDDAPDETDDAQKRFEGELGFWKHWQREKLRQAG